MKILINSMLGDIHSDAVAWGLRKRGHEVIDRCTADFPAKMGSSILVAPNGRHETSWAGRSVGGGKAIDAIWNRRFPAPSLSDEIHPADTAFARREVREYLQSFNSLSESGVFAINPQEGRVRANSKPLQLVEAAAVGLRVPETLITNEPEQVAWLYKKLGGQVIHKNFSSHCWVNTTSSYSNITTSLSADLASNSEAIALAPGIYQARIEKIYDFRITIMGRTCFVVTEQSGNAALIDSRVDPVMADGTGLVREAVLQKCFKLMSRLGIYFGCFDFSQGIDGDEPYFLEVNEMGQWLAYEEIPNFFMLDAFCDMISSRDPDFTYDRKTPLTQIHEYLATDEAQARPAVPAHKSIEKNIARGVVTWE